MFPGEDLDVEYDCTYVQEDATEDVNALKHIKNGSTSCSKILPFTIFRKEPKMGDVSIESEASYDVPMDPIMEREASEEKEIDADVLFPTVSGIEGDTNYKESKSVITLDDEKSNSYRVKSSLQTKKEVKTDVSVCQSDPRKIGNGLVNIGHYRIFAHFSSVFCFEVECCWIYLCASPQTFSESVNLQDSSQSPRVSSFDWHSYLEKTNSLPAPPECFFHSRTPPENLFQADMKLMITDPRGVTLILVTGYLDQQEVMPCIVLVYSVWICVRLEGLDNTNDRWIMCDDVNIKPIGSDKKDYKDMNPPIGFIYHHGNFPKWLEQQLKPDEETGKDRICPSEWFRPISKSLRPPKNLFEIGMKVEAIDQKSFNGKPSPATIVESTKDFIKVNFDGWNSAYDIREPFDSRYVMPVGWSEMVGVEILPPKAVKVKARVTGIANTNVRKSCTALVVGCASTSKQREKDRRRVPLSTTMAVSSQPLLKRLSDIGAKPTTLVRRGRGRPPKRARAATNDSQSILTSSVSEVMTKNISESDFTISSSNEDRSNSRHHSSDKIKEKQEKESAVEEKVREILRDAKAEEALQLSSYPSQTIQKKLSSSSPLPKSSIMLSPSRIVHSPPGPPPPIPKRSPNTLDHSLAVSLPSTTFIPVVATTTNISQSNKFTIPVLTSNGNGACNSQHSNLRPIAPRPPGMTTLSQNSTLKKRARQPTLPVKIMKDLLRLPPEARSQLIDPEPMVEFPTQSNEASGIEPEHTEMSQQLSNGAVSPKPLFGHNTTPSPRACATDFVFVCDDELPQNERTMCLYVNPECRLGPLLDAKLVKEMRPSFGPYSIHHVLREAVQQLINSSVDQGKIYNLTVPASTTKIISITAEFGGALRSRFLPCALNARQAWGYLKELLKKVRVIRFLQISLYFYIERSFKMGTCENFYSSTPDPCQICTDRTKEGPQRELAGPSHNRQPCRTNKSIKTSILDKPISSWSIDKVASELRNIFDESIVDKFVTNQIDGRALLLLKPELLMKHMDMAFGPALKLTITRICEDSKGDIYLTFSFAFEVKHEEINASFQLPLSLLRTAQNHPMLVELKNGETYNGHLQSCDTWMNIHLRDVIFTSKDGDKFFKMPEVYIRGSTVKYLRIPETVVDLVKNEVSEVRRQQKDQQRARKQLGGGARGGTALRGGRGGYRGRGK
uniref:U6 snRNA-associated Sm-like protein LSm4 n=1 Tax=Heterorhabditis bacteriophora TaxID=37862 RepID=A0A1I7XBI1_HETBA